MDDTVAMQDTTCLAMNGLTKPEPSSGDPISMDKPAEQQQPPGVQQPATAVAETGTAELSPKAPQSPLLLTQQVNCDASSVASDGSQDQAGSGNSLKQHGPPRRTYSSVDVDAAKQAAMSALAGLDMTTTKANLDASKAAAATARANGEVPAHVRKSNLRSVSCRQLGTGSSTGGTGKSVAFDEAAKQRPADGARTVQWRAGTNTADGSQPRRTARAPASRCISLPHVLQGRAGMANRLAASYAQEAALQQQLHLLNGTNTAAAHGFTTGVPQLQTPGVPSMDVLSMYQLQQQAAAAGVPNGQLLTQRSIGTNATMDDSMLQLQSGNMMLAAQQQQQQQQQAARLAGNWPNTSGGTQQRVTWAPGTAQVPQQPAVTNQQLLVHMQGGAQNVSPAAAAAGNEALWLQNPAAASAALLSANRPQNLLLTAHQGGSAAGMPALANSSGLLSPHLQTPGGLGNSNPNSTLLALFNPLLEQYQTASWTGLAAAQADGSVREQLLTEVVLELTLLHTLNGVLKSSLAPADALNDLSYLGGAARRHIATFSRLSQAGDLAVQLLAMIAPLACRHLTTTDVMEATFLVLDTLALANRDVSAVVSQQRLHALSNLLAQLPMDQLLQQQTVGLALINSLTTAVTRNKQMLENMGAIDPSAATGQPAASGALLQGSNAGAALGLGGVPLSSQPLLVSPTGPTLSPTGKTPLATYFEESNSLISPAGAAGGPSGLAGVPGLAAAVPTDALLPDGLGGFSLVGQGGGADDMAGGLGKLSLGAAPGLGAAVVGGPSAAAGGAPKSYSPLAGGLQLFGDSSLLVPSSTAASGPSSSGAPAGLVGV